MSRKIELQYADQKGVIVRKPGVGILYAAGTTVPADASADYAPGCIFQDTDASAGSTLYINNGTATSSAFDAILTSGGSFTLDNDKILALGTGGDQAFVNRSTTLAATTALTSVLIGTPVTPALAADSLIISNTTASGDILIAANRGGNSENYLFVDSSTGDLYLYAPALQIILTPTTDVQVANGTGVIVGHTAQLTVGGTLPELQVLGTTTGVDGSMALVTASTINSSESMLKFGKVGNAALGSFTTVAQSENIGRIDWCADDGTDLATVAARIGVVVNASGTVAASRVPSDMVFYLDPGGADDAIAEVARFKLTDFHIANNCGVVIGHTAQIPVGNVTSELQIHGTAPADSTMALTAWSADAVPPRIYFGKSRSATIGTFGIITSGDNLGEILAFGDDGVDFNSNSNASCGIIFDTAGTIAADRIPGVMRLQTATDANPSVLTTAVTIDQAQLVTCAAGLTVNGAITTLNGVRTAALTTAVAITGATALVLADSGGIFTVAQSSAYDVDLPSPTTGAGSRFLLQLVAPGAFNVTVTVAGGAATFEGIIVNDVTSVIPATGATLTFVSGVAALGDYIEAISTATGKYFIRAITQAAGGITIA